jgi:N-methylhydantoinase B
VQGGGPARPGRFTIRKAGSDQTESIDKENAYRLAAGDLVCVETGGGGGYGPPSGRQLQSIERDIVAGYVSAAAAARDYGVEIGPDGRALR